MTGPSPESRLDSALAARGLAPSRTSAARLISEGLVTVDGNLVRKRSHAVTDGSILRVEPGDHYVGRAAHKLAAALDSFPVKVEGCAALDVGASTGGFTQVLLERGARHVIALDVGHDQLAPSIRADTRVTVVEGVNARYLTRHQLESESGTAHPLDVVVADLSFISLELVLPAIVDAVGTDADLIVLIKPQFEVGRGGSREGIVRDPGRREDAIISVLWAAWRCGLPTAGVISSPILGTSGNHEYLAWFSTSVGRNPTEWTQRVTELVHS